MLMHVSHSLSWKRKFDIFFSTKLAILYSSFCLNSGLFGEEKVCLYEEVALTCHGYQMVLSVDMSMYLTREILLGCINQNTLHRDVNGIIKNSLNMPGSTVQVRHRP